MGKHIKGSIIGAAIGSAVVCIVFTVLFSVMSYSRTFIEIPEGANCTSYMLPLLKDKGDAAVLDIDGELYLFQHDYGDIKVTRLPSHVTIIDEMHSR